MNTIKISLSFLCIVFFANTHAMLPAAVPIIAAAKGLGTGGAMLVTKTAAGVTIGVAHAAPIITTSATVAKTVISLPSIGTVITAVGKAACGMVAFLAGWKGAQTLHQQRDPSSAALVQTNAAQPYPLAPLLLPGREATDIIVDDPIDARSQIQEPLVPRVHLEFPPAVYEQVFFPPYIQHQVALWCIMLQTGYFDQYGNTITQQEYEELCEKELAYLLEQSCNDQHRAPQQRSLLQILTSEKEEFEHSGHDHRHVSPMQRMMSHMRTIPYHGLCRRPMQYPEGSRILDQLPIDQLLAQNDNVTLQQIKNTLENYRFPHRIVYPATKKKIRRILNRINDALAQLAQEQRDRVQQLAERISNQNALIEAHRQADTQYLQSKLNELRNSTDMCTTAQERAQLNQAIELLEERINHPTTAALQKNQECHRWCNCACGTSGTDKR